MYAVAVRDDQLNLILRIRRSPKGDVYALVPRDRPKDWKPHASYHASGQYHHKSSGRPYLIRELQKPDDQFCGTWDLITMGVASNEPRLINSPCQTETFSDVFEIPVGELRAERYQTYLSVDLVEPGGQPIVYPGSMILRQNTFRDAVPWIMVTLFET